MVPLRREGSPGLWLACQCEDERPRPAGPLVAFRGEATSPQRQETVRLVLSIRKLVQYEESSELVNLSVTVLPA